ncbi:RHS repeat domain-containing protein, partial [Fangia hongkongensis]
MVIQSLYTRILTWLMLMVFAVTNYAATTEYHLSASTTKESAKSSAVSIKREAVLDKLTALAAQSSADSFQSQAGNHNLGIGVSVNPATLSMNLNQKIVDIKSTAHSNFSFPLSIVYAHNYNKDSALIGQYNLSLNIPYLQLRSQSKNTAYYNLSTGENNFPFKVTRDQKGDISEIHFLYEAPNKASFGFVFQGDKAILTTSSGVKYIFEKGSSRYLYRCTSIISATGEPIYFDYNGDVIKVLNGKQQIVAVVFRSGAHVRIQYLDHYGTARVYTITQNTPNVTISNPLGQNTTLGFDGHANLTNITLANGSYYSIQYGVLDKVNYIIDGETQAVDKQFYYVKSYTQHMLNRYSENKTYRYFPSVDGSNFAGNNITCSKAIFDALKPLQDWMMQCGFSNQVGRYRYSTTEEVTVPVFNGTNIPDQQTAQTIRGYNYLQLQDVETRKVDGKLVSQVQSIFNPKVFEATKMADLSPSYNQPLQKIQRIYDQAGIQARKLVTTFDYYNDTSHHGELKSMTDPYGNSQTISYYSRVKGIYQSLPSEQTSYLYQNPDVITTHYSAPQILSKTVKIGNTDYQVDMPYITQISNDLNGTQKSQSKLNYDIDPNSLGFGLPMSTTRTSNGQSAAIENQVHVQATPEGGYVTWSERKALKEHTLLAPTQMASTKKYYNQYGALLKTVDPITGDITTYDSHDALGRVTQLSYYPAGQSKNKQVYRYDYQVLYGYNDASSMAGYALTISEITPTSTASGYSIKRLYNANGQLVRTEAQTQDQKQYFTKQEYYYNSIGKLDHKVNYYYDETGKAHPSETRYFYDRNQDVAAVTHPDGSTSVTLNDPYHLSKFTYVMQPTGVPTTDAKSLCFNPLVSNDQHRVYNTCKVASVSVQSAEVQDAAPSGSERPIWIKNAALNYRIILDPNFRYTDKTGQKVPLYNAGFQGFVSSVTQPLTLGLALDYTHLANLADHVKEGCLNRQSCVAASFEVSHLDHYKRNDVTEDYVNGYMIKRFYDPLQPDQLNAQSFYLQQDDGSFKAIKTQYYSYDQYGNRNKIEISSGDYNPKAKKTLVGVRTYSALGYLLNASTLVNTQTSQIEIRYDQQSGLPIEMQDALGNRVHTTYDSTWKNKPATIYFYQQGGTLDFTVSYLYTVNGNLKSISKYDQQGVLISQKAYQYDPLTHQLFEIKVTDDQGDTRTVSNTHNNYFTLQSQSYSANQQPVYQTQLHSNALGQVTQVDYQGVAHFSLSSLYNPDLSLKARLYDQRQAISYEYNPLGQLIGINNYVNTQPVRSYQYGYDRLGRKSLKISNTESTGQTTEHYDYSRLSQLVDYQCSGDGCPRNLFGQPLSLIHYQYNNLFNTLDRVTETPVNQTASQTIQYRYQHQDPTQVSEIDYATKGKTTLNYDANGNVIAMSALNQKGGISQYHMKYDAQQNLVQLDLDDKQIHYGYNASGQQTRESVSKKDTPPQTLRQYYLGGLSEQRLENNSRYYVAGGSIYQNQYQRDVSDGFHLTGSLIDGRISGDKVYTPFGLQSDLQQAQKLALTIQKTTLSYRMMNTDQETGWQFFGDGYRGYDARLRVFLKHDSASPWAEGGINGYVYADNDPVNGFDPSGHATDKDVNRINKATTQYIEMTEKMKALSGILLIISLVGGVLSSFIPGGLAVQLIVGVISSVILAGIGAIVTATYLHQNFGQLFSSELSSNEMWKNILINSAVMVATFGVGRMIGAVI